MAEMQWIKLRIDMFDDEKIKIIQSMPDGDALLVVWIRLIALAGKCNANGLILVEDEFPYTDEMLSVIFNKPLQTVKLALATFEKFRMIESTTKGIYITNAVKTPKLEYTIDKGSIENSLPYLEAELSLFPNVKVIMLMGDVAKKAFNMITKKASKKNAVPAVSTYKLRNSAIYYEGIRIMPSYIMTGGNILIEKSKVSMAAEDIATMLEIIR